MLADYSAVWPEDRDDELRATALRMGAELGWEPAEVQSFAAKLAGRPWRELDDAELSRVVQEFWQLILAIATRRRRRARRTGGRRARLD